MLKTFTSNRFQESYHYLVLANGLKVVLYPKEGYNSTYVIYSTNFGSDDIEFKAIGKDRFCRMPAGVAHFLEHKMFETSDGTDATEKLAALGADTNAFTSNTETAYLFSTTGNVIESLKILLDFVGECSYTEESIEREKDIIEQERSMYADIPNNVAKYNALKLMYQENSVRNDIAGTKKSIKQITKYDLDTCYATFYHPSNMKLVIVGKFDYQEVAKMIEDYFKDDKRIPYIIERKNPIEILPIKEHVKTVEMDVNIPIISMGIRINSSEIPYVEKELKSTYITYWLKESLNINSDFYQNVNNSGLITGPFTYFVTFSDTYEYIMITASSKYPNQLCELIKKEILSIKDKPLDFESIKRYEKSCVASVIRSFNSIEAISDLVNEALDANMPVYDYLERVLKFDYNDLSDVRSVFDERNLVVSKVVNIEK